MPADLLRNPLTDALFEQATDFIGLYDLEAGWFLRVNPAGAQLLGYPSPQALYDDPARSLAARRPATTEWTSLPGLAPSPTGPADAFEVELRRPAGDAFRVQAAFTALTLNHRPYLLVRLTDNSRLHVAERNLAQSVQRFEAVFTHATIGIIVCNRGGDIVLANEKAQQLFDYSAAELLAIGIEALVPDSVRPHHQQLRASFNANPAVRAMSGHRGLVARRRDGSVFPAEISLSYFYLAEELYVVAYIVDITVQRETERALQAERERVESLNADLERQVADRTHALQTTLAQLEKRSEELTNALAAEQELGELKSRFVSMASHEFRTPLTAVLTSASLIEKYPLAEQQDKRLRHLDRIRASVKHLTDILEEFLSVGKIEEGRVAAQAARLHLPALVHEAVAEVQGLRKPGQRIEQELRATGPMWLDTSLLRKVLVNLLSNALKYSGESTTTTVRATAQAGRLTITVQDQGVGISRDDQEHLFERFFRARNATNIPGTGLGLYIIARYLELMGGSITLTSELHVGTTVTITVPYEAHFAD